MLFRYPGGKGKLTARISSAVVDFFNNHSGFEYREPFYGGGAIGCDLLNGHICDRMWINDFDAGIFCIWLSVHHSPAALIELIEGFKPSVEAFYEFKEYLQSAEWDGSNETEIAFKKIAIHQTSYSGLGTMSGGPLGGAEQLSDYPIDCRWNPKSLAKNIKHCHDLMWQKKVWISNLDFEYLISSPGYSLFYLDPPYYEKGPELYQCSFSEQDHVRLRDALRKTDMPWLLSYDNNKEIKKLYDFAKMEIVELKYSIKTSTSKTELLIAPRDYAYLLEDKNKPFDIFGDK